MSAAIAWEEAIGYEQGSDGQPLLATVLGHLRGAVIEAGFVGRGHITRGLKEAYRPLGTNETALSLKIDDAIRCLCLSGDVDEFSTSAGRGYAATPPRLVDWGHHQVAVLGATTVSLSHEIVRRIPSTPDKELIRIGLEDELGRSEWRSALVELGAVDAPGATPVALFDAAQTHATGGERYSLDEPQAVAVLSGRGEFFGQAENAPVGRWKRIDGDGCFPAVIRSGYSSRSVVLSIAGGAARLWQPSTLDVWRWIVVGATLAAGDPVLRYDRNTEKLDFLTPPPMQAERTVLLTGTQIGPWSWTIDAKACGVLARLMGSAG